MYDFEMELILKEKDEINNLVIKDDVIFNIDDYVLKNINNFISEYDKIIDASEPKPSYSIITHIDHPVNFSYCVPRITNQSTMMKNAYSIDEIRMIVSRDIIRKETELYADYDYGFVIKRNIRITKNLFVDLLIYSPSAELMIGMQGMIKDIYFNKNMKELLEIDSSSCKIKTIDIEPFIQDFKFNINKKLKNKNRYEYGYDTLLIHDPSISNDTIRKFLMVPKPYYCKTFKNKKESIITKEGGFLRKIFR